MFGTDYSVLTSQDLATTGQALYGPGWRASLAFAFGVTEAEIVAVERDWAPAPPGWRAQLISLAQDMALRALEAANNLLWRDLPTEEAAAQQPVRPASHRLT